MKRYLSLCLFALSVVFAFNACSDVPAPYGIPGQDSDSEDGIYLQESFSSTLGSFTSNSAEGNLAWIIDYSSACITGYDKVNKVNNAGVTYLVSPYIDLSYSSGAHISFSHAINYEKNSIKDNNQLVISKDYEGDVNTATWEVLPFNTDGTNADFTFVPSGKINIPSTYIGQKNVVIAFRHSCGKNSSTWEVKNVVVKEGIGDYSEDNEPEAPETTEGIFSESFDNSLGNFTIKNVKEAIGLDGEVWQYSSQYTCAKATSYTGGTGGQNIPTESWLISPAIDLSTATSPVLAFEHAANFFTNVSNDVTVWITDATAENWVKLDVPTYPTSFTFVNSGDIDLTSYVGKSVKIGFKYVCESKAGTYELKNLTIKEKTEEETPSEPGAPVVPVEGNLLVNGDAETWSGTVPTNWTTASTAGNGSLSKSAVAHTGNSSICIAGSTKNTRLGYKETTLKAGTYTLKFYAKASTAEGGSVRPGYTPVTDGKVGNYMYGDYVNDLSNTDWTEVTHEFTLSEETTLCLVIMNSKVPGKDVLIDDVSLTTTDGGLADGSGDEEEDTPAVSVTYTKVNSISAGTYIIAANVDGNYKVATPLGATANYGYLKNPVDATADGNNITLTSAANEFVIESTTGGYTIKDGNNKYYYMTGTYDSFNVGTSLPSEGGVWTIDFNADGTVNITNTTMNKTLQYDTAYTSYGAYDTVKAILPSLYKKN